MEEQSEEIVTIAPPTTVINSAPMVQTQPQEITSLQAPHTIVPPYITTLPLQSYPPQMPLSTTTTTSSSSSSSTSLPMTMLPPPPSAGLVSIPVTEIVSAAVDPIIGGGGEDDDNDNDNDTAEPEPALSLPYISVASPADTATMRRHAAATVAAATKAVMKAVKQHKPVQPPPPFAKVYLWSTKAQRFERSISLRPHRSEFYIGTSVSECTLIVNVNGIDLKHGKIEYDTVSGAFTLYCLSKNPAGFKVLHLAEDGSALRPFETVLCNSGADITYGTVFSVLTKAFFFADPGTKDPPKADPAEIGAMLEAGRVGIPDQAAQQQQQQLGQHSQQQQDEDDEDQAMHPQQRGPPPPPQPRALSLTMDEPLATLPPPPPLAVSDVMFPEAFAGMGAVPFGGSGLYPGFQGGSGDDDGDGHADEKEKKEKDVKEKEGEKEKEVEEDKDVVMKGLKDVESLEGDVNMVNVDDNESGSPQPPDIDMGSIIGSDVEDDNNNNNKDEVNVAKENEENEENKENEEIKENEESKENEEDEENKENKVDESEKVEAADVNDVVKVEEDDKKEENESNEGKEENDKDKKDENENEEENENKNKKGGENDVAAAEVNEKEAEEIKGEKESADDKDEEELRRERMVEEDFKLAQRIANESPRMRTRSRGKVDPEPPSERPPSKQPQAQAQTKAGGAGHLKRKNPSTRPITGIVNIRAPEGKKLRYFRGKVPLIADDVVDFVRKNKIQRAAIFGLTLGNIHEFKNWTFDGVIDPETGEVCEGVEPIVETE